MLNIENVSLHIRTEKEEKEILKGISLKINAGEVHAIMGPNGSGKSTFAGFIAGHENFLMKSGSAEYRGTPLADLSVDQRARRGVFLSFQHPVEIPGVSNVYLLKAALNAKRKEQGEPEIDAYASFRDLQFVASEVQQASPATWTAAGVKIVHS